MATVDISVILRVKAKDILMRRMFLETIQVKLSSVHSACTPCIVLNQCGLFGDMQIIPH